MKLDELRILMEQWEQHALENNDINEIGPQDVGPGSMRARGFSDSPNKAIKDEIGKHGEAAWMIFQALDPSGVSNYPDVVNAWEQYQAMALDDKVPAAATTMAALAFIGNAVLSVPGISMAKKPKVAFELAQKAKNISNTVKKAPFEIVPKNGREKIDNLAKTIELKAKQKTKELKGTKKKTSKAAATAKAVATANYTAAKALIKDLSLSPKTAGFITAIAALMSTSPAMAQLSQRRPGEKGGTGTGDTEVGSTTGDMLLLGGAVVLAFSALAYGNSFIKKHSYKKLNDAEDALPKKSKATADTEGKPSRVGEEVSDMIAVSLGIPPKQLRGKSASELRAAIKKNKEQLKYSNAEIDKAIKELGEKYPEAVGAATKEIKQAFKYLDDVPSEKVDDIVNKYLGPFRTKALPGRKKGERPPIEMD
jgi:hypothetical protein